MWGMFAPVLRPLRHGARQQAVGAGGHSFSFKYYIDSKCPQASRCVV